jgi:nucleoside-diphosphate-sugar epimerase
MIIGVTGANSFLGRNIVKSLIQIGKDVLCFHGDIRNPVEVAAFVKRCNTIYHLAGCNRGSDKDIYETNMLGGANIIASAASISGRHIIFPSSNYFLRSPTDPYSISKKAIEVMLQQISNTNNCRVSILRLCNTYGTMALPFHVSVVATFCWYEANGLGDKMPIIGDGKQVVELVPVSVVVSRFIKVLEESTRFSIVDIRGREFSVIELSEIIRESKKRKLYPQFDEIVNFFCKPIKIKTYSENNISCVSNNLISVKNECDCINLKEFKTLTILPGYQRYLYQVINEKLWLCIVTGLLALDIFMQDEEYVNTVLIDGYRIKCVELAIEYKYKIRNLTLEVVELKYYNNVVGSINK